MKRDRKPVIMIPRGAAEKIRQSQKIGKSTLYAALNFSSDSEDAKRTRQVAIEQYGGKIVYKPIF